MSLRSLLAAALLATPLLPGTAAAALVDGSYVISGMADTTGTSLTLAGTFDVVFGAITGLSVTADAPGIGIGAPSLYSGPGVNEATGTMLSAGLTLQNLNASGTGPGVLNFASDGTFTCGGVAIFSSTDVCQWTTAVFGTTPQEKAGTYTVSQVSAPVPLPAAGLLLLAALGTAAVATRRRG